MSDELDGQEGQDEEFTVNDWQNKPETNVLEKGRYPFEVSAVIEDNYKANSGNVCMVVEIIVNGWKKVRCYLVKHDGEGRKAKTSYKYYNFLFAIGIRNQNKKFTIKKSQIVGAKGLCDVSVKSDGTDNDVQNYSPIDQPIAPIQGVPPETETPEPEKPKQEKPKEEPKEKPEKEEENVENL